VPSWLEASPPSVPAEGESRLVQSANIRRLKWVRGHLTRVHPQALGEAERQELLRLLGLIEQDVDSLLAALRPPAPAP
jgi:hypothetical protein